MRAINLVTLALVVVAHHPGFAESIDPDSNGSQYAWSENAGWINAEPLGDGGPGMRVLQDRVDGWLWSENTGWISLSCGNRSSCGSANYGVTRAGNGDLAGFAWGENIGWLSFSCNNTASCGSVDFRVAIDPSTGEFSGFAWSENAGWVSFSCENTSSCGTVNFKVKTDTTLLPSGIFVDGFESGDSSGWSASVP